MNFSLKKPSFKSLPRFSLQSHGPMLAALVLLVILLIIPTGYEGALNYQNADRVRAKVISTDESDIVDTGLVRTGEQRCKVKLLGGQFKGQEVTAVNRLSGSLAQDKIFAPGDVAFVVVSNADGEITTVTMSDHYRLDKEACSGGTFPPAAGAVCRSYGSSRYIVVY